MDIMRAVQEPAGELSSMIHAGRTHSKCVKPCFPGTGKWGSAIQVGKTDLFFYLYYVLEEVGHDRHNEISSSNLWHDL